LTCSPLYEIGRRHPDLAPDKITYDARKFWCMLLLTCGKARLGSGKNQQEIKWSSSIPVTYKTQPRYMVHTNDSRTDPVTILMEFDKLTYERLAARRTQPGDNEVGRPCQLFWEKYSHVSEKLLRLNLPAWSRTPKYRAPTNATLLPLSQHPTLNRQAQMSVSPNSNSSASLFVAPRLMEQIFITCNREGWNISLHFVRGQFVQATFQPQ
jgi:hypothetical protein